MTARLATKVRSMVSTVSGVITVGTEPHRGRALAFGLGLRGLCAPPHRHLLVLTGHYDRIASDDRLGEGAYVGKRSGGATVAPSHTPPQPPIPSSQSRRHSRYQRPRATRSQSL